MTITRNTNLDGLDGLIDVLRALDREQVKVGVPASKNPIHSGTINMATLAAVHEFGAPSQGIPERSFLRSAIIEGQDKLSDEVANGLRAYMRQGKAVDLVFLNNIGMFASNLVKLKIVNGPFKPLADITVKRKGSSKPLIDTGALRQAITWVVEE